MKDSSSVVCPRCNSRDTVFNTKKQRWFCQDCEMPFGAPTEDGSASTLVNSPAHPLRIFFSYGHDKNRELVDRFKTQLEQRGHQVWIDYKEIGTWQDWKGQIAQGIYDSDVTVAFLSAHAMRNPGVCRNEIAMALDRHAGRVYPVLLEPQSEILAPVTITHLQWLDLTGWHDIRDKNAAGVSFDAWFESKFQEMLGVLEGEGRQFHGDIDLLQDTLRPLTFASDIVRHVSRFIGREWVFAEYEKWLDEVSDSRLLWLTGGPGSGKSAIAAMVAHGRQSSVFGAWFCSFGSIERRDSARALRTLAFQLAARWPDYRRKLLFKLGLTPTSAPDERAECALKLDGRASSDLFDLLLAEPLVDLIWRQERQVLVIDALDELTDPNGFNPILDLIVRHLSRLPQWISLFVTSRPQAELRSALGSFRQFNMDSMPELNRRDIALYLRSELDQLHRPSVGERASQAEMESRLLDRSEGMILYIEQAVLALREGVLSLNDIANVPGGLHGLYRSRMQYLYPNKADSEQVRPLLRLLVGAPGALPSRLARDILGWSRETLVDERSRLGSYLIETATGHMRLFHRTFAEWLCSEDNRSFYVDATEGARRIAGYLCSLFKDSNHNFLYSGPHADQLLDWLPLLAEHVQIGVSTDALIDIYLKQVENLDLRSGNRPALLRARRHLRFARDLIGRVAELDTKWSLEPRLASMAAAASHLEMGGRGLDPHAYGLMQYLCARRHIRPTTLANIGEALREFARHQPYWAFVSASLSRIYLDETATALDALEDGVAGAHNDGRVSALHQLISEYLAALEGELGQDFERIDGRIDALAARLSRQGDWDDWVTKVQGLKSILRQRAAKTQIHNSVTKFS